MAGLKRRNRIPLSLAALGAAGVFFGPEGGFRHRYRIPRRSRALRGDLVARVLPVGGNLIAPNTGGIMADERDLRIQHTARRGAGGAMSAILVDLVSLLARFDRQAQVGMRPFIVGNVLPGLPIAHALTESVYPVTRCMRERR